MGVSAKTKWAIKRKEFDSRLKDLERRKLAILVLLEFLSM
jgi:hypothetical protein